LSVTWVGAWALAQNALIHNVKLRVEILRNVSTAFLSQVREEVGHGDTIHAMRALGM
jgi:hypothetical protein